MLIDLSTEAILFSKAEFCFRISAKFNINKKHFREQFKDSLISNYLAVSYLVHVCQVVSAYTSVSPV